MLSLHKAEVLNIQLPHFLCSLFLCFETTLVQAQDVLVRKCVQTFLLSGRRVFSSNNSTVYASETHTFILYLLYSHLPVVQCWATAHFVKVLNLG